MPTFFGTSHKHEYKVDYLVLLFLQLHSKRDRKSLSWRQNIKRTRPQPLDVYLGVKPACTWCSKVNRRPLFENLSSGKFHNTVGRLFIESFTRINMLLYVTVAQIECDTNDCRSIFGKFELFSSTYVHPVAKTLLSDYPPSQAALWVISYWCLCNRARSPFLARFVSSGDRRKKTLRPYFTSCTIVIVPYRGLRWEFELIFIKMNYICGC